MDDDFSMGARVTADRCELIDQLRELVKPLLMTINFLKYMWMSSVACYISLVYNLSKYMLGRKLQSRTEIPWI